MFVSKVIPCLSRISRLSGALHSPRQASCSAVQHLHPARCLTPHGSRRHFNSAADNKQPPKFWTPLDPELEEVLVPRKLSVSPLESWLSLSYSLPPLLEASLPLEDVDPVGQTVPPPPSAVPVLGDGEGPTPLSCKNVLEIRRRKMNRHKYKKLLKRTKFLRRRVMEGRRKRKQVKFERDLTRIWRRAGLKKAPEGWTTPKIFIKQYQSKGD